LLATRSPGNAVDLGNTNQILDISKDGPFCGPFHNSVHQADNFPRLKAAPGSQVIARYLENGHISSPVSSNSTTGEIYWFGRERIANEPRDLVTLSDVQSWRQNSGNGTCMHKPDMFCEANKGQSLDRPPLTTVHADMGICLSHVPANLIFQGI